MVRKKTEKNNDVQSKKPRGRKQQTQQAIQPASDSPTEISDSYSRMFNSMMPMIMMVLMLAIITPMMKTLVQNDEELKNKRADNLKSE